MFDRLRAGCVAALFAASLTPLAAQAERFKTDFSRSFQYLVPHKFNTSAKAATRSDGVLAVTVAPGMFGASTDQKKGKERAQYARGLSMRDVYVRQSFRVKVPQGFRATKRTQIAQIKHMDNRAGVGSPPIAVYLDGGGKVKCNDYASGRPSQDDKRTKPLGVHLTDGAWHVVVMELMRSDNDGFCRVTIDGRVMIEMRGIDTDQNGQDYTSQIGIYRDALPYQQTVIFDDWSVISSRKVPSDLR